MPPGIVHSTEGAWQETRSANESDRMTLTKAELADLLFEKVGLNKREAKDMVEAFFDEIRLILERGEEVKLANFGNFDLREKPPRPGRNPKTGEEALIKARRVVTFHASANLMAAVGSTVRQYPFSTLALNLLRISPCHRLKPFTATTAAGSIPERKCVRSQARLERSGAASSRSRLRRRAAHNAMLLAKPSPP